MTSSDPPSDGPARAVATDGGVQAAPRPAPPPPGNTAESRRLHPWTLALRLVVSAPALVFLLLPVFRSPDGVAVFNLVLAFLYAGIVLPSLVLNYLRFRYHIDPAQIVIESGVTTRTRRSIPVDRIQNVEIEQQLLQRLTGTARVRIYTAGSPQAEGTLEVVSLAEAERIRASVRAFQRATAAPGPVAPSTSGTVPAGVPTPGPDYGTEPAADAPDAASPTGAASGPLARPPKSQAAQPALFEMDQQRVLLSGMFRFSLLYVGLVFSALQYWEPDPEALFFWLWRGPLEGVADVAEVNPWMAGAAGLVAAVLIGWLSGIAVNLNRFFRFRLTLESGRLHRSHGLLSRTQATIPLRKVQTLIVRTNPLMRAFGWYTLEVQTMGFDAREQGHAAVVPFARLHELREVADVIRAGMPDRGGRFVWPEALNPVSRLTIRRAFIRYALLLGVAGGVTAWYYEAYGALWALGLLPAYVAALYRWRSMGYLLDEDHLVVRRGVLRQHTWIMPVARTQVVYVSSSIFQRRLGLRTLYVDTAGASPALGPDVIDLPESDANALALSINARSAILVG